MIDLEEKLGQLKNNGLEGELEKSKYYGMVADIMGRIHSTIPKQEFDTAKVACKTQYRQENFEGENYNRAVMYLLSNGCEWALKKSNGCTVCGHIARQTLTDRISTDDFINQFFEEFNKIDFKKSPLLNLYNNGSFLNDNEIPALARKKMLEAINNHPDIKMLVLETRPEFVTPGKVEEIKKAIPNKHVELAMGLELKDDFLRTACINKGFTLTQYEEAARHITKYLHLRSYVMLKPPFFTENEALKNAVETIEYAFSLGSSSVSLEACTVQDFTLVEHMKNHGLFDPPKLWSIIEVVEKTHMLGKLMIGLFQFFPSPSKVPFNCEKCSPEILTGFRQYNADFDISCFEGITCDCKEAWEKELEELTIPIEERLEALYKARIQL